MKKAVIIVRCIYCLQEVVIPKVKGITYTAWPVKHEKKCYQKDIRIGVVK